LTFSSVGQHAKRHVRIAWFAVSSPRLAQAPPRYRLGEPCPSSSAFSVQVQVPAASAAKDRPLLLVVAVEELERLTSTVAYRQARNRSGPAAQELSPILELDFQAKMRPSRNQPRDSSSDPEYGSCQPTLGSAPYSWGVAQSGYPHFGTNRVATPPQKASTSFSILEGVPRQPSGPTGSSGRETSSKLLLRTKGCPPSSGQDLLRRILMPVKNSPFHFLRRVIALRTRKEYVKN
jgi:hypothetical protein